MRCVDASTWRQSLRSLPARQKLFRYDVKTQDVSCGPNKTSGHPFRIKPVMGQGFKTVMSVLFGEKSQEEVMFTKDDILLVHDGRVPKNAKTVSSCLTQAKQRESVKEMLQNRVGTLRLVYDNNEFRAGSFAAQKRESGQAVFTTASSLPEPVESISVVLSKDLKLPVRSRNFVDLGGDSRDRAWTRMSLRPYSFRSYDKVSESLLLQMVSPEEDANKNQSQKTKKDKEDESDTGGEEEEGEAPASFDMFAWEADEAQARELFQIFDPRVREEQCQKTQIIDFCAGFSAAMAAIRDRRPYRGYCASELTRAVLLQGLLLEVALCIQSQAPGFALTNSPGASGRVLTRAQSLGGDDATPVSHGPERMAVTDTSTALTGLGEDAEQLSESGAEET